MASDLYDRISHRDILKRFLSDLDTGTLASAVRVDQSWYSIGVPFLYRKLVLGPGNDQLGPFATFDRADSGRTDATEAAATSDTADVIAATHSIDTDVNRGAGSPCADDSRGSLNDDGNGYVGERDAQLARQIDTYAEGDTICETALSSDHESGSSTPASVIDRAGGLTDMSPFMRMFDGLNLSDLMPAINAIMGRGQGTEWRSKLSPGMVRAIDSIQILSLGAHSISHLSHGIRGDKTDLFDQLSKLEVLHIASEQFHTQYEVQDPDAIPPFRREWVYCWHKGHEECDMVKHFRPRILVLSDMPQLFTTRMEGFSTAEAIPDSVHTLVVTVNLADYECRVHNYYPTFFGQLNPWVKHVILIFSHMPDRHIDTDDQDAPAWSSDKIVHDIAELCMMLDCKLTVAGLTETADHHEAPSVQWDQRIRAKIRQSGPLPDTTRPADSCKAELTFVATSGFQKETWAEVFDGKEPAEWL